MGMMGMQPEIMEDINYEHILTYRDPPLPRNFEGHSKKIGQTTQKMIHFVPNMWVCLKIVYP